MGFGAVAYLYDRAGIAAEARLQQYFLDAHPAGSLIPQSSYGRMVAALESRQAERAQPGEWRVHQIGSTGQHGLSARLSTTEMDGRLAEVLDADRQVRRALAAAGPWASEVLWAGCVWSGQGLEAFGRRAPLASLTKAARAAWLASATDRTIGEWLVRLSHRVRLQASKATAAERLLVGEIAREASGLWREALSRYMRAEERWSDLQRERKRRASAARTARVVRVVR